MKILSIIKEYSTKRNISFIVAGGNAINSYGYARSTGDLDLIVKISDLEQWKALMQDLSYKILQDGKNFCRFQPNEIAAWPIDLMIVNEETFNKILTSSPKKDFNGTDVQVPAIVHLIAMKIHSLKNDFEYRKNKDLSDIIELMRIGQLAFESDEIQELILKYGNDLIKNEIKKRI